MNNFDKSIKKIITGCMTTVVLLMAGIIYLVVSLGNKSNEATEKRRQHDAKYKVVVYTGGFGTSHTKCDSVKWHENSLNTWKDGKLIIYPRHRVKKIEYK